jgi:hypothetical protein
MPEKPIFVNGASSYNGLGLQNLWKILEIRLGFMAFL